MLSLQIQTENAAFEDEGLGTELARILRKLADKLEPVARVEGGSVSGQLYDANGNRVGDWKVTP